MSSDGIVSHLHIVRATAIVEALTMRIANRRLREVEPAMGAYLERERATVLKLLVDAKVEVAVAVAVADQHLTSLLIAVEAVRHATYALWEETEIGTRMAQSDPALADSDVLAKYKAARRRAGPPETEAGPT